MIIGLTYDLKDDWNKSESDPKDCNAEFDKPQTVELLEQALVKGGHTVKRIGNVERLLSQIDNLEVDIVFNMCEGISGRNRESQVPVLLEMKGIPFVGSDGCTLAVTLDKIVAKKLFIYDGIPTPQYYTANSLESLNNFNHLKYPLFVKTCNEGSSKGINEESRVDDFESLKRRVSIINRAYNQLALIEEFIRGAEFTIAVIGNDHPVPMPVVQTTMDGEADLGDRFYTNARIYDDTVEYVCPAAISEDLTKKIQDLAVRVYQCVECKDFGRVDFRVDEKGNPYVLEINPLPSLDAKDIFHLFPNVIGSSYNEVIEVILELALSRNGLINKKEEDILKKLNAQKASI